MHEDVPVLRIEAESGKADQPGLLVEQPLVAEEIAHRDIRRRSLAMLGIRCGSGKRGVVCRRPIARRHHHGPAHRGAQSLQFVHQGNGDPDPAPPRLSPAGELGGPEIRPRPVRRGKRAIVANDE